jgi:acetyl-CoA carboxylase carboxyltransferase component
VPLHPLQTEWDADLTAGDPLGFPGYVPPAEESVLTGRCAVELASGETTSYALIAGRFDVLGGSMGAAHGERVARAYRRAAADGLPVVVVTSSGGARMQEGMVALVQMARTAAAARDHQVAGLLQLAVHRNPTTGGVFASYGSLADIRAAEPGATVGFAGPRVVEHTTGSPLPAGSHTAESAYDAALVDALVADEDQAAWVETALGVRDTPLVLPERATARPSGFSPGPYGEVQRARDERRPSGYEWVARLASSWTELRGVDPVMRAGLATIEGRRLMVVAMHSRGPSAANGPGPAGFRLAQRAINLAGRIGLPVLTFVDTRGADPRAESEADGIAGEIARTFAAMDALPTPSVAVCVGEGGSGGALAVANADVLLIQEHAIFSVIAPAGAAAILHRAADRTPQLAAQLKLTSGDLLKLGIVDEVVPDDEPGPAICAALDRAEPGGRRTRPDAATAAWLHEQ